MGGALICVGTMADIVTVCGGALVVITSCGGTLGGSDITLVTAI